MSFPYDYTPSPYVTSEPRKLKYVRSGKGRFPRLADDAMGNGVHRSGWVKCYEALASAGIDIVIDDFVEQTFALTRGSVYHHEPFIGFFHYPPDPTLPRHCVGHHASSFCEMFSSEAWSRSADKLVAAFCLSEHLASYLSSYLDVPVHVVKHPSDTDVPNWSPRAFRQQPRIVQVGAFYRDTRAISRIDLRLEKIRLLDLDNRWIRGWDGHVARRVGPGELPSSVRHINRVTDDEYDHLLSTSVVLTNFFAASASNVVVECIARNTPLIVNRIPAVVEYLGEAYPLYQDRIVNDEEQFMRQAVDAHLYLAGMTKEWLSVNAFASQVRANLEESPSWCTPSNSL